MKLLFLDIDGVLNSHAPRENGYCGIESDKVLQLNRILRECPDVQIVLSSAWRYCVHNGWCNRQGLEHLLLTHGICCKDRIHGVTDPDPESFNASDHEGPFDVEHWKARGLRWRKDQIFEYWAKTRCSPRSVVLDDLPLDLPSLVQTDPATGLTAELADEVIRRLEWVGPG